jgi:asparagine synthase (glutamine-hydrolysing)
MCGITGFISNNAKSSYSDFNTFRDRISHRGPDGFNTTRISKNVVLGHRRLSVIDLSDDARQPMSNEDSTIWLTYNGEIYNFKPLRELLISSGHKFRSHTDSEILIHGYEEWGFEGLLDRIEGMFAFAIYDSNKDRLYAARDRVGIKPFYYHHHEDCFSFGSELKGVPGLLPSQEMVNFEAIADFLIYRFIPSPKTIYKQTFKLPPAHYLTYDRSSDKLTTKRYWNAKMGSNKYRDHREVVEETERLLRKSIESHLISDVPVGVFLSGGYDSSAIVHFMNKLDYNTETFSIGFKDWKRSEHEAAKVVADLYKTTHHEQIMSGEPKHNFQQFAYHYDEPLGGSSFMPTFAISEMARKDVTVALGGDGGDEIFGGYNWHYEIMETGSDWKEQSQRFFNRPSSLIQHYRTLMDWSGFTYSEVSRLFRNHLQGDYQPNDTWLYDHYDDRSLPRLKRLQRLDFMTFLPEVICTKVDRASMAHSLEVRVPFLSRDLINFLFSLHSSHYYEHGTNKKLLRDVLKPHLPDSILNKRKQGFGSPFTKSDRYTRSLKKGYLVHHGIIDIKMLEKYIQQGAKKKIWALFILDEWFKCWIN